MCIRDSPVARREQVPALVQDGTAAKHGQRVLLVLLTQHRARAVRLLDWDAAPGDFAEQSKPSHQSLT
eukprot:15325393-Alexandrium_andersonii.AAC.1